MNAYRSTSCNRRPGADPGGHLHPRHYHVALAPERWNAMPAAQVTQLPLNADQSYVARIRDSLVRDPAHVVIHSGGNTVSAGDLLAAIGAVASALSRLNIGPSDVVAVLTAPNVPALLVARYAAHSLGAAVTHIRSMNARSDLDPLPLHAQARVLIETGARVLAVDAASSERARALRDHVPHLVVTRVDGQIAGGGALPHIHPHRPQDLAAIDLTSGTTGYPKLVRHSFGARERQVRLSAGDHPRDHRPILLCVTPISHATSTMVDAALLEGGAVVLLPEFDPAVVLTAVGQHRVTDMYLSVPALYQLLDHPDLMRTDLSSLRRVIYSGTPAAPARIVEALAVFGDRLAQLYGSTEAGGICTLVPLDHREPELLGSVGRPFSWVDIVIRELDSDAGVPQGGTGEVCVRSATVMDGYLNDPDHTARVLRDGWLRTGDLGYVDRYGYLRLIGRTGNVIKCGGLKIHPSTVEHVLLSHPLVANAAVFGVRDRDYRERVCAAVQLRSGACCSPADLSAYVAGALSPEHVPAEMTFWNSWPLTESGKPDHGILRRQESGS
ncbi:MAG: AMP-binding protein [Pseudonocardia sp.]|nr:AMP-binding protein [Pseudonocardia sp.]